MEGFESAEMEDAIPEFTLKEIIAMERLFKDVGEKSLSQEFCQELVDSFSRSKHRTGKPAIQWEQVQSWFQDKQKQIAAKVFTSPVAIKEFNQPSDWALRINVPERLRKTKAERVAGLSELAFEAKSFKDFAWYDVAAFLNYRVIHTGELEVRVRFSGFSYDQDEWVNVKRGVRERSIPLEPSECHRVKVGDPVLCFRETDVRAIYCDAYIVEIQRSTHETPDCPCKFVVRYTYDNAEAKVPLSSLCCRPA
ncbi:protein SAWADEE HOMEODOMAIN HOMOLOG 1 [Rhododendron vialii]|uniref:protein SAWADEE HOMEODOMAIN HOMOLOG 1 n=1 Tax=Rhododendron vialii TaxID=182163 RepID=UPI00265FD381|nr:protein SAWADEE HOMEODOMAIN HOMOLOG 1 [Rhododendron vialii]XP_058192545.1 protein SAWADEE HOMEODOMAIN HOMOLOG 1 [Rhododendron vialii]XP_058192546.1 protein SAWADEE HOMEODOMAIN HOMOLOG 1 [Rhododendron vialii]